MGSERLEEPLLGVLTRPAGDGGVRDPALVSAAVEKLARLALIGRSMFYDTDGRILHPSVWPVGAMDVVKKIIRDREGEVVDVELEPAGNRLALLLRAQGLLTGAADDAGGDDVRSEIIRINERRKQLKLSRNREKLAKDEARATIRDLSPAEMLDRANAALAARAEADGSE